MSERDSERQRELERGTQEAFERRAKEAFDRSVAELDAQTRSRLKSARFRAVGELERTASRPSGSRWTSAPAGSRWTLGAGGSSWTFAAAGTLAAVAVAVSLALSQREPATGAGGQAAALGDLAILVGEEDLEMLDEELDFYAWLEQQPELSAQAAGDDGVG